MILPLVGCILSVQISFAQHFCQPENLMGEAKKTKDKYMIMFLEKHKDTLKKKSIQHSRRMLTVSPWGVVDIFIYRQNTNVRVTISEYALSTEKPHTYNLTSQKSSKLPTKIEWGDLEMKDIYLLAKEYESKGVSIDAPSFYFSQTDDSSITGVYFPTLGDAKFLNLMNSTNLCQAFVVINNRNTQPKNK